MTRPGLPGLSEPEPTSPKSPGGGAGAPGLCPDIGRLSRGVPTDNLHSMLLSVLSRRSIRIVGQEEIPSVMGCEPLGVCVRIDGDLCIAVRDGLPVEKRTWVLAHELGHYVLHADEKVWPRILFDPAYHDRLEREADKFSRKLIGFLALQALRSIR